MVAVVDPQRVIPNYSLHNPGRWAGKLDGLQMLIDEGLLDAEARSRAETVLREHPRSKPSGRAVVESNDLLLEILRPHFTDGDYVDTWGMRTFLHWLSERVMKRQNSNSKVDLAVLAEELLCDVGFLENIVALLEDKGQVILYGPPGTGKTHVARELAWALTAHGDSDVHEAYSLVQFHPAYSYEDFFEGFRPQVDGNGQMTYELVPGPLVRIAERAQEHPDELHVMVIDSYRFDEVRKRHDSAANGPGSQMRTSDVSVDDDEPRFAGDESAESHGDE